MLILQHVCLRSLVAKPELNGCRGQVLSYDRALGRYEVMMRGSARTVYLRAVNLELLSPSPAGSDPHPIEYPDGLLDGLPHARRFVEENEIGRTLVADVLSGNRSGRVSWAGLKPM